MPFAFNPVTGDLDLVQDVTGYVEKAGDTMTGTLNTQNLLPATTATYSLGDASKYYTDVFASRYYLNATAYLDGGVAGVIGATGNLTVAGNTQTRRLILSTGTTTDGIYGDVASGIVRLSGGTLNDGAVMLLGGSTHGSIANTGLLRVGATNIAQWTTAGFSPGTDSARTLGTSSLYWSNTYTDRLYLNSTAYLNGATAGQTTATGSIVVENPSSSSFETFSAVGTGAFAGSRPMMTFKNTAGSITMTELSASPGSGYANSEFRIRVANSSKALQERLKIDVNGTITAPNDVEITDTTKGVILTAPDASRWRITVDNSGNLTTTSI